MRLEHLILLFICVWVFYFPADLSAAGQERAVKGIEQLESMERDVICGKDRVRMTYIRDAGGEVVGMEYFRDHQRYVNIGDKEFPVKDVAHTLVSSDRKVILKYGQEGEVHLEHETDLYWYDGDRELANKIVGNYRYLRVAMSPDGYVAVCGKKKEGKKNVMSVFKPGGEVMSPTLPLPPPKGCLGIADSIGQGHQISARVVSVGRWKIPAGSGEKQGGSGECEFAAVGVDAIAVLQDGEPICFQRR